MYLVHLFLYWVDFLAIEPPEPPWDESLYRYTYIQMINGLTLLLLRLDL